MAELTIILSFVFLLCLAGLSLEHWLSKVWKNELGVVLVSFTFGLLVALFVGWKGL